MTSHEPSRVQAVHHLQMPGVEPPRRIEVDQMRTIKNDIPELKVSENIPAGMGGPVGMVGAEHARAVLIGIEQSRMNLISSEQGRTGLTAPEQSRTGLVGSETGGAEAESSRTGVEERREDSGTKEGGAEQGKEDRKGLFT